MDPYTDKLLSIIIRLRRRTAQYPHVWHLSYQNDFREFPEFICGIGEKFRCVLTVKHPQSKGAETVIFAIRDGNNRLIDTVDSTVAPFEEPLRTLYEAAKRQALDLARFYDELLEFLKDPNT